MNDSLRASFGKVAGLYARVRPGYPAELFDDLVVLTGLEPGARVLEIGCATGQATLPMAQRGYHITAVELSTQLAGVARSRLAAFPGVTIETGAFEAWPLTHEPFDLVMAATAWHWLDQDAAFTKYIST